jgi:CHAT domain-containing protein
MLGLATVSIPSILSRLCEDDAVLTFLSGPDRIDVFVVRRGLLRHTRTALGDRALAQRVRLARELLAGLQRSPEVSKALGDLYDLLLGGAERAGSLAGVRRLLIVPHGSLGALPFGALWNRHSGKFLIEERVVSFLPTIAALTIGPRETRAVSGRLVAFAPLSDSLPGTVREVRAIASVRPGTELRIGSAANESGIKAALVAGASVHIASHGSHNSQNPLFSRMVVGRARPASGDDGHLDVHEILELQTRSPLVFLSGCETGLGSGTQSAFEQGSEEGSLAQAFLIAGAQTVVATLWRVDDAESVELAKTFYRQIQSGAAPADALARAQRGAIGQAGYSWAAYTVSGMWQSHRLTTVSPLAAN